MTFLNVTAKPGERVQQRVPIAELPDGSALRLPVVVIRGREDGPVVYIQAGLHGDEMTGIEICRLALPQIRAEEIRGTVVVVPLANVPAHLTRTRGYLHEERWLIDINRSFPGNPGGLLTERIADILFNEFVAAADFSLDLHSALDGCNIAPFVYLDEAAEPGSRAELRNRVGLAFGTPNAYFQVRGDRLGTSDMTRSLSNRADAAGHVTLSAEMGESRRATTEFLPIGVRGVHNVLRAMGVEPGEPEGPAGQRRFTTITLVHAAHGGGLRQHLHVGDEVREGQRIAEIVDVFGETVEELASPVTGFILRSMLLGSVSTGAEVAWVAS